YAPIKSDRDLMDLYTNALFLIYPSLYEGFGFPIIEAFGYGCPVLTGNTSSMKEIGGDLADYFNPYSIESMTTAIQLQLKNNDQILKNYSARIQYSQQFTWDRTIKNTLNVYKELEKH
ncbi:MAG: glycosyltransferase, partial [Bacteroidota bacterium]|nr:glycosyltransferase [Bacteroidota bacterium]